MSIPPELISAAQQYGIDPATLMAGGDDPSDPPVLDVRGHEEITGNGRSGKRHSVGLGALTDRPEREKVPDKTRKASDVDLDLYRMSPAELRSLQQRLFTAGLYGGAKVGEIKWGDPDDPLTAKLWSSVVTSAARRFKAGFKVTPMDVVAEWEKSPLDSSAQGPQRAPLSVELTNPTDIRQVVEAAATSELGRKPTAAQVDKYVRVYQALQRQSQEAQYAASDPSGGGGTSVAPPDLSTFAQEQIRGDNPVEAGAHDVANMYDTLMNVFGASRGMG